MLPAEQICEAVMAAAINMLHERGIAGRRTKLPNKAFGAGLRVRAAADPGLDATEQLEYAIPVGARASRTRIHS